MQLLFLDSIRQSVSNLQEYNYQPKTLLVFHNQASYAVHNDLNPFAICLQYIIAHRCVSQAPTYESKI